MKKIPTLVLIYFDYPTIYQSLEFLTKLSSLLDIYVIENPSSQTKEYIRPYILRLKENLLIKKYILFDKNISNNAVEVYLKSNEIRLDEYDYVIVTDGDLVCEKNNHGFNNWLVEEIKIIKNPEIFSCSIQLDLANLPVTSFPESINWIPDPISVQHDYIEGLSGLHFSIFRTSSFLGFFDFLQKNNMRFLDSHIHWYSYEYLHLKLARTKLSTAKHLTWDLYQDLNHPYTQLKLSKKLSEHWNHSDFCSYSTL